MAIDNLLDLVEKLPNKNIAPQSSVNQDRTNGLESLLSAVDKLPDKTQQIPQENIQQPQTAGFHPLNIFRGAKATALSTPQAAGGLIQNIGESLQEKPKGLYKYTVPGILKQGIQGLFSINNTSAKIGDFGKKMVETNKQYLASRPDLQIQGDGFLNELGYGLGSGVVTMGAALATTFASGGNPAPAAALFGLYQKGNIYNQARKSGKSPKEAGKLSTMAGIAEGGLEFVGLDLFFRKFGGKLANAAIKTFTEAGQEAAQQAAENLIVKRSGIDKNRGYAEGVAMSALIGGILGGGTSVALDMASQMGLKEPLKKAGLDDQQADQFLEKTLQKVAEVIPDSEVQKANQEVQNLDLNKYMENQDQDLSDNDIKIKDSNELKQPVPDIPKFKNTSEAESFGKSNIGNKEIASTLKQLREASLLEASKAKEVKDFQKWADKANEAQFYREAIQGIEGTTPKLNLKESTTQEDIHKMDARRRDVILDPEKITDDKIIKTEIVKYIENEFNVPVRSKLTYRFNSKYGKTLGHYQNKGELIRLGTFGDIETLSHEVAHHIDKVARKKSKQWKGRLSSEIKEELRSLDYDQRQKRLHEGFAEFVRHYVSTGKAQKLAPNFYKYFTETFLPEQGLTEKISKLKSMMETWYKQGAENRVLGQIDYKGETVFPDLKSKLKYNAKKTLDNFNKYFIDEFSAIKSAKTEVEKRSGIKLRPSKDPFVLATFAKNKSKAIARTMIEKAMVDEYGNKIGKSLVEILSPIIKLDNIKESLTPATSENLKNFFSYGISKRSLYLAKRGIESGLDIQDIRHIIEKYKNPQWDTALSEITEWSNQLMDWLVRAGGISEEVAQKIKLMNPVYLPFKRIFIDEVDQFMSKGKPKSSFGPKRIKGSGRPIINPLESLIDMATSYIQNANKMRVVNAIIEMSSLEGSGKIVSQIPRPIELTKLRMEEVLKKVLDELGGEFDIDEDLGDQLLNFFSAGNQFKGKGNVFTVWRNGKPYFYELHPDLYKSLQGIDDIKIAPIMKVLGGFTRFKRLGATGLRAGFAFTNAMRDFAMSSITSKREIPTPFDPLIGVYKDIFDKPESNAWKYKAMGGEMATMMGFDRSSTMKFMDEMLLRAKGFKGKTLYVVKHPIDALRSAIQITEMGPRIKEFDSMYEKYKQKKEWSEEDAFLQAFNDAQDITVNFTRSGTIGKQYNTGTAFFNAAIQGINKIYRSAQEDPVRFTVRGIAWITLPAILSWLKNKDKDWYKNLVPEYKYRNIFIEIENKVFRIPLPFELGAIFAALPLAALDKMATDDPKAIKGFEDVFIDNLKPPIVPDIFQPAFDVMRNKNWLNQPIESEGMKYAPKSQRYRDYTSSLAKELSNGMEKLGFKEHLLSPVQIDYLLNGYTGGAYSASIKSLIALKEWNADDLPILGRLVLRMPEKPTRLINDFYERKAYLDQQKNADFLTEDEKKEQYAYGVFYRTYLQPKCKTIKEPIRNNDKEAMRKMYIEIGHKLRNFNKEQYKKEFVPEQ